MAAGPALEPRTVVVLPYEGVSLLDVTGPAEVFSVASRRAGGDAYQVVIASLDGGDVTSSTGFRLGVTAAIDDVAGPIDTLVVPGGGGRRGVLGDAAALDALRRAAARSRRVAAVCTGAFLLAEIGLLDGRRATTHWSFLGDLARRVPSASVEGDPIFVGDGHVWTSAGVTSGIDLALALVEADHGPELARSVARFLVVFMQRPGGQSQFSARLHAEPAAGSALRPLLDAVAADPAGDHRLAAMSGRAGYSERHLARVFAREVGLTPARYVERVRVETARSLLETSDASLATIAARSGLGSAETLRRAFTRAVGVAPHAYRQRFRTTGVGTPDPGGSDGAPALRLVPDPEPPVAMEA